MRCWRSLRRCIVCINALRFTSLGIVLLAPNQRHCSLNLMIFLIRLLLCPFLLYVTGQMQSDCLILRRESKFRNFKSQENFSSWFIILLRPSFYLRMQTACLYRWSAVHSEEWPTLHTSTSWMRRKLLLQSGRYKSTTVYVTSNINIYVYDHRRCDNLRGSELGLLSGAGWLHLL